MAKLIARVLNKIVRPFGVRCVPNPEVPPVLELPEQCLKNSRIVSERADILKLLPKGGVVAEVGVAFGRYSRIIIDGMQPESFVAIDTFNLDAPSWFGRKGYKDIFGDLTHEEYYRQQFRSEIASGRVSINKGCSAEVLSSFPDLFFDMIYIDAAHDYDNVKKDLEIASRKIKDEGTIILNDYTLYDPLLLQPYGIVQATNEFCINKNWEILYLALHRYMFCDVALKKIIA
jgi:hypothetical protein